MKKKVILMVLLLVFTLFGCRKDEDEHIYKESARTAKLITEMTEEYVVQQEIITPKEVENIEIAEIKEKKEEAVENIVAQGEKEVIAKNENYISPNEVELKEDTEKITTNDSISAPNIEEEDQVPDVETEVEVETTIPVHEHIWEQKFIEYDLIQEHIYGCNGCGFPLFTRTNTGVQFIDDLYFHPPCATDRFEADCTGGGFHSEYYTEGYCVECGDRVSYRQCMWTENGKRCIKNEAAGSYEKVEYNQNYFMYFDACACGSNIICKSGVQPQKGLILDKKICSICGMEKKE